MSEIRHDPLLDRWVIIAPERAKRPQEIAGTTYSGQDLPCPFCEGHETETPPELWALRESGGEGPDTSGWTVRVVPNRFPALRRSLEGPDERSGLLEKWRGVGAHEVIIESPGHTDSLADLPLIHVRSVLEAYRLRLLSAYQDRRLAYALIFKNHKVPAGASLVHPHSQLIATPVIPQNVRLKLETALQHHTKTGTCLLCTLIQQEKASGTRVIHEADGFIALAPFASRFPFEAMIAPVRHMPDFTEMGIEDLSSLSGMLKDTLLSLKALLDDPPYNYFLNTTPNPAAMGSEGWDPNSLRAASHWHLEILPRQLPPAGFEWGSGFHINPAFPEESARLLREICKNT